jgi:hypothetical protein
VRVRIKTTPEEREIDGVGLKGFQPGMVRDVSSSLGSWLIAEGYAEPEMRAVHDNEQADATPGQQTGERRHPR